MSDQLLAAGVVIVGAGHAGFQCADSLRRNGFDGRIVLVNGEADLPYQRPPLSKGHLLSPAGEEALWFRTANWFDDQNITLLNHTRVESIQNQRRQVSLSNGEPLDYQWLVLAPGARLRTLELPGANLDGVCYVKSMSDIRTIARWLPDTQQIVVVGGSFIALEFAATAAKLDKHVTVLVRGQRLMNNAVDDLLADYMLQQHRAHGVDIRFGTCLEAINGEQGRVASVLLNNGNRLPAQMLVAGIGVEIDTDLAQQAGLACGERAAGEPEGIRVDRQCLTSDNRIFAAGDAVISPNPYGNGLTRLESVQNAVDQAKLIATVITAKSTHDTPNEQAEAVQPQYDSVPWFWSDQYDIKLQMAGLFNGYDQRVQRGDTATGKFSTCYLRDGVLIAVHSVNKPADHMQARKLVAARIAPDIALLADENIKLNSLF
ncbi:NAD(P)/FAD-dependent oxidoreductase [Oceanobacter antarcticus]|uniref:FAD-dependent oxidoreductase n=1 Tax=Oceanobacter antarcticus TaxID=3133425 RepID=A0ABW8NKP8_9GAMM